MKYPDASQWMLGGMAVVLLTAPGCSSMSWFHSGSDDTAVSESDRLGGMQQGQGAAMGSIPLLSRQNPCLMQWRLRAERCEGFHLLVNGQIAGEERLSRSTSAVC